jgi:hypothetical protein
VPKQAPRDRTSKHEQLLIFAKSRMTSRLVTRKEGMAMTVTPVDLQQGERPAAMSAACVLEISPESPQAGENPFLSYESRVVYPASNGA